jgi:serine/threonine-protein kinase
MIDLRLLGAIEVRANGPYGPRAALTQPKRLALLAYLALAEPRGLHSRDALLALLWPDADDGSSRHSLRNALHALRQSLGDEAILTRGESWVGLDFDVIRCDVLEVRSLLGAGRLDDAVALCRGDLMPGFHLSGAPEFDRWLEEQRADVTRALRRSAWERARELAGAGAAELEAVRRAVRLDPGDEPGARRLMTLLAASGDLGGALAAHRDVVDWFARELDAEPSVETRLLADRLRTGGVARRAPPVHADPAPSAVPDLPEHSAAASSTLPPARGRRLLLAVGLAGSVALGGAVYLSRDAAPPHDPSAEAELAVLHLPARYRADTAAYRSYLRGLALRFDFRFMASRDTLAALVEREPLYVPGLYGLAHAWVFTALNELTDPEESWPKIHALASRALALDSTAASAWLVLASEDMFVHQNLSRAGERLLIARRLDPYDADVAGVRATWFRFHGQMDSAIVEARLAHRLDPLSLLHARLVARQLYLARRYDESWKAFEALAQDGPRGARVYLDLAQLSIAAGRTRDAVHWLRRARAAQGDSVGAAALTDVTTDAAARQSIEHDARRTIARLDGEARRRRFTSPSGYARAYATLRDTTATFRWLDSMLVRRDSYRHHVRLDPVFDFLRGDPKYRAWESRSGLPPMRRAIREEGGGGVHRRER